MYYSGSFGLDINEVVLQNIHLKIMHLKEVRKPASLILHCIGGDLNSQRIYNIPCGLARI